MLPGTPEAWRAGPRPSGTAAEPGGREHGFAVLPRRPRPGSPTTACGRQGQSVTLGSCAPPKPPGARAWIPGHDDGIESRRPSGSRDHGPGRAVRSPSARGGGSVSVGHPCGSSTPTQSPRPRPGQAGTSACPACPAWGSAVTMAGAVWRPAPCPRGTRPRRQAATAECRSESVFLHRTWTVAPRSGDTFGVPPERGCRRHPAGGDRAPPSPCSTQTAPGRPRPGGGAAPTESRGALRGRREEQKVGRLWQGVQRREQRGRRGGGGREDAGAPETPPVPRRPRLCDPGFPGDGRRLCTPPRSSAVSLLIEEVGTPRRRRPGRGEDRFLCFKLLVCGDLSL